MKILQVVSFFSPRRGGGVISTIYSLSKALVQRGNEVTIYTSDFELDREYINSLEGTKIWTFHSYLKLGNRPLLMPGVLKKAREEVQDFDIIHMHEYRSFFNIVLHHYARKYGIPYIVDAHGATSGKSRRKKWLLDTLYGRRILKDATRVIAETELGANEYKRLGVTEDKITIIYPPFPTDDFASLPSPGRFRKTFNIKEKHILTFMGRISQVKGVDFLAQSFYELNQQRDDIILAIIGSDDGYKAKLEGTIKQLNLSDKILLTGFLSGDDKMSALVDTTVLIQPSSYEQGLPRPCIEAILCDTPFVITKGTGASVIAGRMGAAYQIEYGNKQELIDTVQYILDNSNEAANNVQKAQKYIMENLSMESGIEEYEKLYATCLKERKEGDI